MRSRLVEELEADSWLVRARIEQRADGLYEIELERFLEGDPLEAEPSGWWPIPAPKMLTDSLERARQLARESLATLG